MAVNGCEALEKAGQLKPDVVLMDISMPLMDGLEATRQLRATMPEVRILMLTMHDEPEYVMRVMHAGAAGYVQKDISADKLLSAIVAVHQGISLFPALSHVPDTKNMLTPRETEVLILLVRGTQTPGRGNSSGEIARELDVSTRTVETHRRNIIDKLGARTPLELVEYARKHGLI